MKITWGHKLIMVFIVFGSMMTYMVYRSFGTRVDLVSKEYYNDELQYQQLIDGAKSVSHKGAGLALHFAGRVVTINATDSVLKNHIKGTAWFYCVSDSDKDQKVVLGLNGPNLFALGEVLLQEGSYVAKLRWTTDEGDFYSEQNFKVQ